MRSSAATSRFRATPRCWRVSLRYLVIETLMLPAQRRILPATLMHFIDDPAGWRLDKDARRRASSQIVVFDAVAKLIAPIVIIFFGFGIAVNSRRTRRGSS